MVLDTLNNLYSFGRNDEGQLGFSLVYSKYTKVNGKKILPKPTKIDFFSEKNITIKNVICGSNFTFVLDVYDLPYSFGDNSCGQLARNTQEYAVNPNPEIAEYLTDLGIIKKICCGWSHAIMLNNDGEAYVWGNYFKDYKKVCNIHDTLIPKKIKIEVDDDATTDYATEKYEEIIINRKETTVNDISSGSNHLAVIILNISNKTKELFTWGANEFVKIKILSMNVLLISFEDLFKKNIII